MKNRFLRAWVLLAGFLAALLSQGCATILKGTEQDVLVTSEPSGAKLYVNQEYRGTTPATLKLPVNQSSFYIEVKKEGFEPSGRAVSNSAGAGWIIADALLTLYIGLLVDGINGAWNYLPDSLALQLEPRDGKPAIEGPPAGSLAPAAEGGH